MNGSLSGVIVVRACEHHRWQDCWIEVQDGHAFFWWRALAGEPDPSEADHYTCAECGAVNAVALHPPDKCDQPPAVCTAKR